MATKSYQTAAERCLIGVLAVAMLTSSCGAATRYVLSESGDAARSLRVTVDRPDISKSTMLVLRGARFGGPIPQQVQDLRCDGHTLLSAGTRGTWFVPAGCRKINWRVPIEPISLGDASAARSVASSDGSFRLLSEASSLPRLADGSVPEILDISKIRANAVFPQPRRDKTLVLPDASRGPLFLLMGSMPAAELNEHNVRIVYFVDERSQLGHVPSIATEMAGLQWLTHRVLPQEFTFAYLWLGLPSDAPSLGGAAGDGLLLVNYTRGAPAKNPAMIAAAPLVEATHQIAGIYGSVPTWVGESLAVYFGIHALEHALPDDPGPLELERRFLNGARKFPPGLLEVQRRVWQGDSSNYSAFFTKGVAFWTAVDGVMKHSQPAGLDAKFREIVGAPYGSDGRPPANFAATLGLRDSDWRTLERKYLGK